MARMTIAMGAGCGDLGNLTHGSAVQLCVADVCSGLAYDIVCPFASSTQRVQTDLLRSLHFHFIPTTLHAQEWAMVKASQNKQGT